MQYVASEHKSVRRRRNARGRIGNNLLQRLLVCSAQHGHMGSQDLMHGIVLFYNDIVMYRFRLTAIHFASKRVA
jgi:hypothetical protein